MDTINNYEELISKLKQEVDNKDYYEKVLNNRLSKKEMLEKKILELEVKKSEAIKSIQKEKKSGIVNGAKQLFSKEKKEESIDENTEYDDEYNSVLEEIFSNNKGIVEFREIIRKISMYEELLGDLLKGRLAMARLALMEHDEQLANLERENNLLEQDKFEMQDCIRQGKDIINMTNRIDEKIDQIFELSGIDFWTSGLHLDYAKYDKIENVQNQITTLNDAIKRFNKLLAIYEIKIEENLEINISNSLRNLDIFFDGLISRHLVNNKVSKVSNNINDIQKSIESIVHIFERNIKTIDSQILKNKETIETILNNVTV